MLLLMLWLPGEAHVGAILEGIDFVFPGPSLDANFGLLVSDDGERYQWVCHEAVTAEGAVIAPRYSRSDAGTWLVTIPATAQARDAGEPVYRSTDLCDWAPVDGLEDRTVPRVDVDPTTTGRAYAITADVGGEIANGIFRSTDDGRRFEPIFTSPDRLFRALAFEGGAPNTLWVTAAWYAREEAWILHSVDGGDTWTERPIPTDGPDPLGLGVDADVLAAANGVAYVAVGPFGADRLLRTNDGGATFEVVLETAVDLVDAAITPDGDVWVVGTSHLLYRSTDGGRTFVEVADPPGGFGVGVDESGVWATGFA